MHLMLTGVDNCGRTVMVVVGRNIPVTLIDMDKVSCEGLCRTDDVGLKGKAAFAVWDALRVYCAPTVLARTFKKKSFLLIF